jgi:hypothetical protein
MAAISTSPFTVATSTIPVALPSLVREAPKTPLRVVKPITPTASPVLTSVDSKSTLATIPEIDLPVASAAVAVGSTSVVVVAPATAASAGGVITAEAGAPEPVFTITLTESEQKAVDKLNAKRKQVVKRADPEATESDEESRPLKKLKAKKAQKPKPVVKMETDEDKAVDAQAEAILKKIKANQMKTDLEKKMRGVQSFMPHITGMTTLLIDETTELKARLDHVELYDPSRTLLKADTAVNLVLQTGETIQQMKLSEQKVVERLAQLEELVAKLTTGLQETQKQVVELKSENAKLKQTAEAVNAQGLSLHSLSNSIEQFKPLLERLKKADEAPDMAPLTVRSDVEEIPATLPPTQPQAVNIMTDDVAFASAVCTAMFKEQTPAKITTGVSLGTRPDGF